MMERLRGKVAVVTGSGRGVGRRIAIAMASEGAKVVVNDLGVAGDGTGASASPAEEVVNEIKKGGAEAVASFASVAEVEGAESIIKTAIDSFGRIDVLVNNAGILRDRMIWNMTDEEWDGVIKAHLYGHFNCTRAAVGWMRDAAKEGKLKSGRIINITSHAGIKGNAGQPNYAAAKMGVVGFTYSCAMALGRYGITCNAIAPRAITRLTDTIPGDRLRELAVRRGIVSTDESQKLGLEELKRKLLGGGPEAIAPLVCWLASNESSHVNGHVFMMTEGKVGIFNSMEETKLAFKDGIFSLDELWNIMPIMTAGLPDLAKLE
jgi:NAD(P)-dependent dehydrogenase (short-subunit alcohol dehydrogenase family)